MTRINSNQNVLDKQFSQEIIRVKWNHQESGRCQLAVLIGEYEDEDKYWSKICHLVVFEFSEDGIKE